MHPEDQRRYSRQILFSRIGPAGQEKLLAARVVIVGCGALGTPQASLLARAGVGELVIIDRDFVEESNLQRQTLFTEQDA
ncbi:MAG TPA: ThiF family adenylyltransferase, partial [Terriglobia bacterium]|nr:ThiF family adenylyltransferase [Terriglobia bacterium]